MEILEVSKQNAIKAYNNADKKGRILLEDLYGKQALIENIKDAVKTFKDACSALDIDHREYEDSLSSKDEVSVDAYRKLIIIAKALNKGWQPDWNDSNEYKYYPWFKMRSGFGFSFTHYGCTDSYASVGSRLCFKTEELAEYAGKQFEDIYKDYLTN